LFLLDAPADVRQRAKQIESRWHGRIMWHPDRAMGSGGSLVSAPGEMTASTRPGIVMPPLSAMDKQRKSGQTKGSTTQVGYINRNHQEVIRATGNRSTHPEQLVYVLWCRKCGHQYGANGCDISRRRCPAHDRGAPGIAF